jgi:hypothetical protein
MRRFATAFAAITLVAACANSPEPIEPKTDVSTPAKSARPAPSATPPTLPKIAKRQDATGAANFVLYWVKAFNYGASTGDTGPMREHAKGCSVCTKYANDFDRLPPSKLVRGQSWTLSDISVEDGRRISHVNTTVQARNEDRTYPLTFVVKKASPYELSEIFERTDR